MGLVSHMLPHKELYCSGESMKSTRSKPNTWGENLGGLGWYLCSVPMEAIETRWNWESREERAQPDS